MTGVSTKVLLKNKWPSGVTIPNCILNSSLDCLKFLFETLSIIAVHVKAHVLMQLYVNISNCVLHCKLTFPLSFHLQLALGSFPYPQVSLLHQTRYQFNQFNAQLLNTQHFFALEARRTTVPSWSYRMGSNQPLSHPCLLILHYIQSCWLTLFLNPINPVIWFHAGIYQDYPILRMTNPDYNPDSFGGFPI